MGVFDENIETPLDPYVMYNKLCEEAFGYNFADGSAFSIYWKAFDENKMPRILRTIRNAFPGKNILIRKMGFGQLKLDVDGVIQP